MKKLIINLADSQFEKLRFEALEQRKDFGQIIRERLFSTPFSKNVEEAFNDLMEYQINEIMYGE